MAVLKTPGTSLQGGDVKNAAQVFLSVAVGMGLVLVLAVVLTIEKCVAGYTGLREKFRRAHTSAGLTASIDSSTHPGGSLPSLGK